MTNEELLEVIEEAKASGATELDLHGKRIATLPPEIGQLTNLTTLYLYENQLSILPPEIGQLTNLTKLYLYENQLFTLPSELFQLTNLTWLSISGNKLTILPPEIGQLANLTWLDLRRNLFTTLPPAICQLKKLYQLILWDNQSVTLPPEIAKQGIDAIRQYFIEREKDKRLLNEVKILLIGEGSAGKTSLVKQLLDQPFDQHEDTTHGISIQGWEPQCGGKQIKVNIWDFGGQEIQHATHQFFLSKRSLYVLVLDGRKDERTEYWLRHIEAFGGSSPVLIVLNKIDSNPAFDVNRSFLRKKYPGIREFFSISCKSGKGLAQFKEALLNELAKVEMLETIWPGSWFSVKRRLEEMDRPYISAAEYKDYCAVAGIAEDKIHETLLGFLHDLGVAVHFNDFILDAMHVLDPVWVTEAVYKIITAEKMVDSKGVLRLNDLREILPYGNKEKLSCPSDTHPYIMRLMQKFELCYELDRETVLIPQLLPVPEPKFEFDYKGSLCFALHYPDFLPPSVFPRFMVKAHKEIKAGICWRTGVLLEDKRKDVQAVVKADVEDRRINIWVQGERHREYLHYLRYLLAGINSGFEKLSVSERVPMPDAPHVTADYETLLNFAEQDVDVYFAEGSKRKYSVKVLLGLVQPESKGELAGLVQKIDQEDEGGESWTKLLNELVEPKITVLGITFNLKGFFEKLLARQKQKRQQARK